MIPLERLGEYTEGIERINIELSIANKLKLLDALEAFFRGELPVQESEDRTDQEGLFADRPAQALELIAATRRRWQFLLANLDRLAGEIRTDLDPLGLSAAAAARADDEPLFSIVQTHAIRVSWKRELLEPLRRIFDGRAFEPVLKARAGDPRRGAARAACSWRCTCTRATATCTPTSR